MFQAYPLAQNFSHLSRPEPSSANGAELIVDTFDCVLPNNLRTGHRTRVEAPCCSEHSTRPMWSHCDLVSAGSVRYPQEPRLRANRSPPDHPAAIKTVSGSLKNIAQLPTLFGNLGALPTATSLAQPPNPSPATGRGDPPRRSVPGSGTAETIS